MSGSRVAVLWLALGVAVSATLADLAAHLAASPWARGAALAPLLFAWAARTDPTPPRPARDGFAWVALGLAASLAAVAGGMTRAGRPAVALAAIGLARATGRPSLRRALLALWIVPVPSALLTAFAPGLAGLVAAAASHTASLRGVEASVEAHFADHIAFVAPGGALDLFPADGGLPLAWTLAGIGWFAAVSADATPSMALRRALRLALAAIPLQLAALALACSLALAGWFAAARGLLDHFVLLASAAALAYARLRTPYRTRLAGAGVAP